MDILNTWSHVASLLPHGGAIACSTSGQGLVQVVDFTPAQARGVNKRNVIIALDYGHTCFVINI